MTGLDTNVVIRVVTADDPKQLPQALSVFRAARPLYLSKTVLLETEWVLRYSYELSASVIHKTLQRLIGLSSLTVEDRDRVIAALDWFSKGMDFADALHLASSQPADEFVSFDRSLAHRSAELKTTPPVRLLDS
ncbi:MAG TPA: type II toxin-antitoxin system VapC family toxin [Acidobacteriota bacterium]|nr:type II toxin-antitoxin system VapC family toxin [Acidobacteriota bacterium]